MTLLEVKDLVKSFRSGTHLVNAVDHVDLRIDECETLGLVGESGCGKTTLSRCILHLERPTSGSVLFGGRDVAGLKGADLQRLRREIQIVFQDPYSSLDPRWRIADILAEPLRVHSIVSRSQRAAEIARLLDAVGLPAAAASRYPHEFSGGQRQRIGIARALATRPRLLIADEPVSALDISVRANILNLLRDLQCSRSLTILFIAHDLAAVRQISSRIAVMFQGRIVEEGLRDTIFQSPGHPYTRGLLDALPRIERSEPMTSLSTNSAGRCAGIAAENGCAYLQRCVYAQELCAKQAPGMVELGNAHASRCHFAASLPPYRLRTAHDVASIAGEREGTGAR